MTTYIKITELMHGDNNAGGMQVLLKIPVVQQMNLSISGGKL
jgi:hypothetical protein